ncbi:hypothetical protein ACFE04_004513 [Oxalis oulophora]
MKTEWCELEDITLWSELHKFGECITNNGEVLVFVAHGEEGVQGKDNGRDTKVNGDLGIANSVCVGLNDIDDDDLGFDEIDRLIDENNSSKYNTSSDSDDSYDEYDGESDDSEDDELFVARDNMRKDMDVDVNSGDSYDTNPRMRCVGGEEGQAVQACACDYVIFNHRQIKLLKNDSKRARAECAEECEWKIFASYNNRGTFHIKSYVAYTTNNLVQEELGTNISHDMCRFAKNHVLRKLRGTVSEQWKRLGDYAVKLRLTNLESTVELFTERMLDGKQQFQGLYPHQTLDQQSEQTTDQSVALARLKEAQQDFELFTQDLMKNEKSISRNKKQKTYRGSSSQPAQPTIRRTKVLARLEKENEKLAQLTGYLMDNEPPTVIVEPTL